jgi:signal transduction histidine kinase
MAPDALVSLLKELDPACAREAIVRIAATAELAGLLNAVESGTSRISILIQKVKEYTYMDQAPVQNVDIVRSLETTLGILTHKLEPQINIKRDFQPVPLLVNTVGTELNQVWTNIIENAIDAMPGQGELLVRTFRENQFVVVEIGDNGAGIPPEIKPHIFDPFFTTKGVGEGTGLGLNTVQTIVRKHGGNVHVDSEPGDTRFQVWLPIAALLQAANDPLDG